MFKKGCLSKKILAGVVCGLLFVLYACDHSEQKNENQKTETVKEKESSAGDQAERKNHTHQLTTKSLAYYIAEADSMAVISCYPETPAPIRSEKSKKSNTLQVLDSIRSSRTISTAPVPFKETEQKKRIKIPHQKLTTFTAFSTNNKKVLDDFADATAFRETEECRGICFDKMWSSYYVELFKNGEFIDGTHLYTGAAKGYNKNGFNYYFDNVQKVHQFFNDRNIYPMPTWCFADKSRRHNFKKGKSEKILERLREMRD